MASDDHGDLSIQLDWPEDPLAERGVPDDAKPRPRPAGDEQLASRLDVLEEPFAPEGTFEETPLTAEDVAARLDHVVAEIADVLRAINDTLRRSADENIAALDERITGLRTAVMAMLASKEAEDKRGDRRERESLVARLEEEMSTLSRSVNDALATARAHSDTVAERVAEELQALKRRLPVRGASRGDVGLDDDAIEALANRLADEVEIRVAATLRAKPVKKR